MNARRHEVQQLVDVLVDNVLRHTPSGRAVRVTTEPRPAGGARLVVDDAGGGFEATAAKDAGGSGLGLDIARRIARDAGGTLTCGRSNLGGARVDVELAAPNS